MQNLFVDVQSDEKTSAIFTVHIQVEKFFGSSATIVLP